jgi:hypothetical protein
MPYLGGSNPYSEGNNPYIVQKPNKSSSAVPAGALALQLYNLTKGGKGITKPTVKPVTQPNAGVEGLDSFDTAGWETTMAADDAAITSPELPNLDAFEFTQAANDVSMAGGTLLDSNAYAATAAGEDAAMAGTAEAGGEGAAGSGGGANLGLILAIVKGLFSQSDKATENIENDGADNDNDFKKWYNQQAEHPLVSTTSPNQMLIDTRLVDEKSDFGQMLSRPAAWEKNATDWIKDTCIIVSACTSRESYEVNVSRKYRDRFMDDEQLTGYYFIAGHVAPLIGRHPSVRRLVKKCLVDRLVDYGEVVLSVKPSRALRSSWIATRAFLSLCRVTGKVVNSMIRILAVEV